jgi:hypothetical protein
MALIAGAVRFAGRTDAGRAIARLPELMPAP